MPTLPITLKAGTIAVYGIGDNADDGNARPPSGQLVPSNFLFGTVYNIWAGGETYVYGGNCVIWEQGTELVKLATAGGRYTILPARLVTKDFVVP